MPSSRFVDRRRRHLRTNELDRTSVPLSNAEAESLAGLTSLIESSEDAMISHSLEGRILRWNRGAAALYGYTAEEVLGQPASMLVPPEVAHEAEQIMEQIRDGQRVRDLE